MYNYIRNFAVIKKVHFSIMLNELCFECTSAPVSSSKTFITPLTFLPIRPTVLWTIGAGTSGRNGRVSELHRNQSIVRTAHNFSRRVKLRTQKLSDQSTTNTC